MSSPSLKKIISWDNYRYGRSPRGDSTDSVPTQAQFDDPSPGEEADPLNPHRQSDGSGNGNDNGDEDLVRRRSSIPRRIGSIAQLGGVNSLENFARSWQRAAGFYEITPARSSYGDAEYDQYSRVPHPTDQEPGQVHHKSLLRQQIEAQGSVPEGAVEGELSNPEESRTDTADIPGTIGSVESQGSGIFAHAPHLASSYGSEYLGIYGSLSNLNESAKRHAARLYEEQQATGVSKPDGEREPLLVKRVERDDGKFVHVVVGQSTLPQTIVNSVNVLVGVGLLSLPLGIYFAGWIVGLTFLLFSALITRYTASLLSKCLDTDESLITFADIAYASFGSNARIITSILFTVELIAACVALVVLFADSLNMLIPGWGLVEWKIFCGVMMVPLFFVPFPLLSYSSLFGVGCCFGIISLIIVDGLIKPHAPGSLREPAMTYLFPENWATLPLSFGLLMSPWGGHSVFPNIYRDMRHPHRYRKGLQITFSFTYFLDVTMAIAGLLMFGGQVQEEVTSNILLTEGYPKIITIFIIVFIAIIPLTKLPLNARPIISTLEIACGLDARAIANSPSLVGLSGFSRGSFRFGIRIVTALVILIIAIIFPDFDRIMALMGSALCFTICVILPLAFYLKLFGRRISPKERIMDWFLLFVCSVMATVGTVWVFLPKSSIGAA